MRTRLENDTAFAQTSELDGVRSFFLVGIGGAGMSGIARMLKSRGYKVGGTDSTPSALTDALREQGISVHIGHSGTYLEPGDALVLSDAIALGGSPEVQRANEIGVRLFRRSQALAWLLKDKRCVAVTGSHGKTTTTGMLAVGMRAAGFDPTIAVGAEIAELGTAVVTGAGSHAVIEACEAYDSLRDFDPHIVVLTNLELDHVDYHENWENLRDAVVRFTNKANILVYNQLDRGAVEVAERSKAELVPFAPDAPFDPGDGLGTGLSQKGPHNLANANAALTVMGIVGADNPAGRQAIARFRGAERRQQVVYEGPGDLGDITVLDDYAHHPTEVAIAIDAVRDHWILHKGRNRLIVVFQPHLYTRTEPLINEFATALSRADHVVMTDIYPAREDPIPGVSSFRICEKLTKPFTYVPARHLLPREVARIVEPGDVVLGMGAGNIAEFPGALVQELKRRGRKSKRILVAYAGDSHEREVAILSGRAVFAAVKELGYEAALADLSERALSAGNLSLLTGPDRPDLVVLALHGPRAEDGAIQGLLEFFHLAYTGTGIQASSLAIDKQAAKRVFAESGIDVPKGVVLTEDDPVPDFAVPCVVKPNTSGSTVGLRFVHHPSELPDAVANALRFDTQVLVEELVAGVEISVPVFGDRAMLPVEVVPAQGSYDFANKYTAGATEEICPARISQEQTAEAQRLALASHRALGCRGVTRTDMIVSKDRIVVLELNNLPGMTPTSLVPRSARESGMSFNDVVDWIIKDGLAQA